MWNKEFMFTSSKSEKWILCWILSSSAWSGTERWLVYFMCAGLRRPLQGVELGEMSLVRRPSATKAADSFFLFLSDERFAFFCCAPLQSWSITRVMSDYQYLLCLKKKLGAGGVVLVTLRFKQSYTLFFSIVLKKIVTGGEEGMGQWHLRGNQDSFTRHTSVNVNFYLVKMHFGHHNIPLGWVLGWKAHMSVLLWCWCANLSIGYISPSLCSA